MVYTSACACALVRKIGNEVQCSLSRKQALEHRHTLDTGKLVDQEYPLEHTVRSGRWPGEQHGWIRDLLKVDQR